MAEVKGITIPIRGDATELTKALNKIRYEAREVDKELGYIDKALKLDPKNVDLINQRLTVLKTAAKENEQNISNMKQALEQMKAKGVDQTSEEFRELQREIVKAEAKQKAYNKELKAIPSARLKAVAVAFNEIGDKATAAGKALTTKLTAPIVALYGMAASLGSDYEENLNKIDVAFGDSGEAVKEWANSVRDQFGLSKVQATEAVAAFGALGKGIGLSEEQAAQMSVSLAGLSADLGSYFNTSTEESAKALEGIFTGEAEALKKFGVVMNETNLKQFAEEQGLVYTELSQTEKTMLRYNFVLAKTADAQGDFERTNDGTANSTKIFKAAIQDLGTAIGTQLLPIITPIIQKIADFISKIADLPAPVQKIITIVGLVVAALGPLLLVIGAVSSAIGSILTVAPIIAGAISGVGATLLPIVGIIAGVVAAGVALYKNWDTIKEYATIVKNWVVEKWTQLKDALAGIAARIVENITAPFVKAYDFIKSIVDAIKNLFANLHITIPHIKTPHFSIQPPGWQLGDLLKGVIPRLGIDWYKTGGIFNSPQVIGVGEAGPEAVIPIDKLRDVLGGVGGITVNVYGSDNMSVDELALKVQEKIITLQNRRRQAWA